MCPRTPAVAGVRPRPPNAGPPGGRVAARERTLLADPDELDGVAQAVGLAHERERLPERELDRLVVARERAADEADADAPGRDRREPEDRVGSGKGAAPGHALGRPVDRERRDARRRAAGTGARAVAA